MIMFKPDRLYFGTAGIPIRLEGKERTTEKGFVELKRLGLEAMELEFVHSVNISKEKAPLIKEAAQRNGIVLTCHGPYFINLNALEKPKVYASINRIISSARTAALCGAYSNCFHLGFYVGQSPETTYANVKENLKAALATLKEGGIVAGEDIWVRPETTGKPSAWGDLKETIRLSQEVEGVLPCIDFAHLHARSGGKENTLEEFRAQLALVEKGLGKLGLNNMHIHVSGINYSEKGERNHLLLDESDLNYKDLVKVWKEFKIKGIVICESPIMEKDALILQKVYGKA